MTRFLCQELLYEYATGALDINRQRDMEEFLPTCRDSQRELENLKKGLAYAQAVNSIQVSPSLAAGLEGFEPMWKTRLQAWTLWSFQRGWRMLPYTFLVLATGLGIYVTKPWQKDSRRDLILAEQARHEVSHPEGQLSSPQVEKATTMATHPAGPSLVVQNSVMPTEAPPEGEVPPEPPIGVPESVTSAIPATAPTVQFAYATPAQSRVALNSPIPMLLKAPSKVVPVEAPEPIHDISADAALGDKKDVGPQAGKGSILRGSIEVDAFDSAWPAIRDKIITLGGKAAGNVELGWLRRPDESYFHFTLPESNQSELETFLKTFGPVRIAKERHPRVMPEGQIRIILTVKDGGPNEDDEAAAP